jgi:hypothetical protein
VYHEVIKGVRGERRQYDHMGERYGYLLALLEKSRYGIYINQNGNLDCWASSRLFEHTLRNVSDIDLVFY